MTAQAPAQIWFLTGSQTLYGDEVLAQVAEQSGEIARTLDASDAIPFEIVFKPVLKEADAIRRTMIEASADDACIGVIAWMHKFSAAGVSHGQ
jgi:L-arabinose isomerase